MAAGARRSGEGRSAGASAAMRAWKRPSATSAKATPARATPAGCDGGEGGAGPGGRALDGLPRPPRTDWKPTCASANGKAAGRTTVWTRLAGYALDENQRTPAANLFGVGVVVSAERGGGSRVGRPRSGERDQLRQERNRRTEEAQTNRGAWRKQQEQAHARELDVNDLRHRRDACATGCARTTNWNWPPCYAGRRIRRFA